MRQRNQNPEVEIFRYVTEGTFDAYLYQLVESKQRFIAQIMTSKAPARAAEDVDETYVQQVLPGKMAYNLASIRRFGLGQELLTMLRTVKAVL